MTNGPVETAGKIAVGWLDVMKAMPLVLALITISFALIGLLYYQSAMFNKQRADNVVLFVQMQQEVQKLLSQCIVPPPQQR